MRWYALAAGWAEHWQREADRATGGDTEAQQRILDARCPACGNPQETCPAGCSARCHGWWER